MRVATMSLTAKQTLIIGLAQAAYEDGEYLIAPDSKGDSLAQFIYRELVDVTLGTEDLSEALSEGIRAMDQAERQLAAVRRALEGMQDGQ